MKRDDKNNNNSNVRLKRKKEEKRWKKISLSFYSWKIKII